MLRMRKNEKGAPFGKRGQPSPGNGGTVDQRTRGEPKDLTTRAKGKRGGGIASTRGRREMLPRPQRERLWVRPRPPHPWPSSRRFHCPDELGGSANNREVNKLRFGDPGPRDPLEDLKILFLRKLEE